MITVHGLDLSNPIDVLALYRLHASQSFEMAAIRTAKGHHESAANHYAMAADWSRYALDLGKAARHAALYFGEES